MHPGSVRFDLRAVRASRVPTEVESKGAVQVGWGYPYSLGAFRKGERPAFQFTPGNTGQEAG